MASIENVRRVGALLVVGVRGAVPGDARLEADLDACSAVGVGGVVLSALDTASWHAAVAAGRDLAEARWDAPRNVLGPGQLASLIGYLRARLGDGLVVMVDQEGGPGATLRPERGFHDALPAPRDFAALRGPAQQTAARRQARMLAELGVDVNLAPGIELADDPSSFGTEPRRVTACARAVHDAHREARIVSCLRRFPGPEPERGLTPLRDLVQGPNPPEMILASNAMWPDCDPRLPVARSRIALGTVLRDDVGFEGVVATDAIDVAAATEGVAAEVVALEALIAGADVLIDRADVRVDAFERGHPALRLTASLARAVDDGEFAEGWAGIDRRAARLRALRRV